MKLVEESDIESLTVRNWWTRVQIVKKSSNGDSYDSTITIPRSSVKPTLPRTESAAASLATPTSQPQPVVAPAELKATAVGKAIKSPMVGTFYTAPEPGAPQFVQVGQRVNKGQTVCIIEAMKLMNEIESDFDGIVTQRLVENAQPVEFGQVLFTVEIA